MPEKAEAEYYTICSKCHGTGRRACFHCGGSGQKWNAALKKMDKCVICAGSGTLACTRCLGTGQEFHPGQDPSQSNSSSSSNSNSNSNSSSSNSNTKASPKLSKTKLILFVKDTAALSVSNASGKVKWSSSNKKIAKVNSKGKVTAKKAGKCTITAKTGSKKLKCKVTVKKRVAVKKITISKTTLNLTVGNTAKLTASISPKNATTVSKTWKSDKTSVATVSGDGKVTAKKAGKCTITCTAGKKSAKCTVTVEASMSVSIEEETVRIGEGDELQLTGKVTSSEGEGSYTETWKSDNPAVATVSSKGVVTGVSIGYATITYTAGKKSDTCEVMVMPVEAYLTETETEMLVSEQKQLDGWYAPGDLSVKREESWKSSDPFIATVTEKGLVTANAAGTVTITYTAGKESASCTVHITTGMEKLKNIAMTEWMPVNGDETVRGMKWMLSESVLNNGDVVEFYYDTAEKTFTFISDGSMTSSTAYSSQKMKFPENLAGVVDVYTYHYSLGTDWFATGTAVPGKIQNDNLAISWQQGGNYGLWHENGFAFWSGGLHLWDTDILGEKYGLSLYKLGFTGYIRSDLERKIYGGM